MMFFDLPEMQYSFDSGKTWRTDGPLIAPNVIMRIISKDGTILWSAHAEETEIKCDCCDGSGIRKTWHYVGD